MLRSVQIRSDFQEWQAKSWQLDSSLYRGLKSLHASLNSLLIEIQEDLFGKVSDHIITHPQQLNCAKVIV